MREIRPGLLWIGNAGDSRVFRLIHASGIRALVQLAYEEPCVQAPRDLIVVRFPLLDGGDNDAVLTTLAIQAIISLVERRVPTLVSCSNGLSRSPCLVAAALAICEQRPLPQVLAEVIDTAPADISPPFWNHIVHVTDRITASFSFALEETSSED